MRSIAESASGPHGSAPRSATATCRSGSNWPNVAARHVGAAYVVTVSDTKARAQDLGAPGRTDPDPRNRSRRVEAMLSTDGSELLSAPWESRKQHDRQGHRRPHRRPGAEGAPSADRRRCWTADAGRAVIGSRGPEPDLVVGLTADETKRISKRVGYAADIAADRWRRTPAILRRRSLSSQTSAPTPRLSGAPATSVSRKFARRRPGRDRLHPLRRDRPGSHRAQDRRWQEAGVVRREGVVRTLRWESDTSLLLDTYGRKKWRRSAATGRPATGRRAFGRRRPSRPGCQPRSARARRGSSGSCMGRRAKETTLKPVFFVFIESVAILMLPG